MTSPSLQPKDTLNWKPTMELRFYVEDGLKILQQKWVRYATYAVSDGPNAPTRIEEHLTNESEWRDVPLVEKDA